MEEELFGTNAKWLLKHAIAQAFQFIALKLFHNREQFCKAVTKLTIYMKRVRITVACSKMFVYIYIYQ